MKTINNIQKIAQKTIAIVASFILISLTVSAQNFWKEFVSTSQFEEIVFAYTENTTASKTVSSNENLSSSRFLTFFELEIEEELELEDWMVNETNFVTTFLYIEELVESQLELENWMIDEIHFKGYELFSKLIYTIEDEQGLELESWMLNKLIWNL